MTEDPTGRRVVDASEPGGALVNVAFLGTGALLAVLVGATAAPDSFDVVVVAASVTLFAVGTASCLWAYALGVVRSRDEQVDVLGLFFLVGVGAGPVRWQLRGLFATQVVAAVVAASVRPFSDAAFGVLAPMFGLGLMALWGGRHGTFAAKDGTGDRP